jgi:hypoxanthine-DNA glycosylase
MQHYAESFPPIITRSSKLLILGTMPGRISLEAQQYYANNQNAFWRVIFGMFGEQVPPTYKERIAFVKKKNIAIWDVLRNCEREGSLDENIINEEPNDFAALFARYPGIRTIVFNGGNSHKFFKRYVGLDTGHKLLKMPSTSPSNTQKLVLKLEAWKAVRELL